MRDSVPSARYSPVCNVLRQLKTSLIPTYRVYRLYDIYVPDNHNSQVAKGMFAIIIHSKGIPIVTNDQ